MFRRMSSWVSQRTIRQRNVKRNTESQWPRRRRKKAVRFNLGSFPRFFLNAVHPLVQGEKPGLIAGKTDCDVPFCQKLTNVTGTVSPFSILPSCTMLTEPWIVDPVAIAPQMNTSPQPVENRSNGTTRTGERRRLTNHPQPKCSATSVMGCATDYPYTSTWTVWCKEAFAQNRASPLPPYPPFLLASGSSEVTRLAYWLRRGAHPSRQGAAWSQKPRRENPALRN